jgi:hypothetical protein
LSIGIAPPQNCCREKEWHNERRERERKRVFKSCFLTLFIYKTLAPLFSLFLDFPINKKLHKHPPIDNAIIHNKTLSLQTKSLTQTLKIEKNCKKHNQFAKKSEKEKEN